MGFFTSTTKRLRQYKEMKRKQNMKTTTKEIKAQKVELAKLKSERKLLEAKADLSVAKANEKQRIRDAKFAKFKPFLEGLKSVGTNVSKNLKQVRKRTSVYDGFNKKKKTNVFAQSNSNDIVKRLTTSTGKNPFYSKK